VHLTSPPDRVASASRPAWAPDGAPPWVSTPPTPSQRAWR